MDFCMMQIFRPTIIKILSYNIYSRWCMLGVEVFQIFDILDNLGVNVTCEPVSGIIGVF